MQHLEGKLRTSVEFVSKSSLVFVPCDNTKKAMKSAEFDENNVVEDDDADLKEKLQACQHFLVDSEL